MNYHIQAQSHDGTFVTFISNVSSSFADGYINCHVNTPPPRQALRVLKGDKVSVEVPASNDVHIGMIAGWPTAEQYRRAADRAITKAEQIEAFELKNQRRNCVIG